MLRRWMVICSVLAVCALAAPERLGAAEEDPTLIGWWKMDESAGTTAADASGLGNDAVLKNGPVWVKGFSGNAVKLDGKNDYVAIDNFRYAGKGIPAVTVATWIRTSNGADQYIASFDRDAYWQLVINGGSADEGQVAWLVTTDGGFAAARTTVRIDDGKWHHVAAVFDNGKLTIHVDGAAAGTVTKGKTFGNGMTRYGFLGIGSLADKFDGAKAASGYLDAELDDVRIYGRALAQPEIELLAFRGPANDMSTNAAPVGEVDKLPFDTRPATHDGEGLFITSPNLWYLYTPTVAGRATVSLAGSEYDTMVVVYRGAEGDPTEDRLVGANDDFEGLTSQITFDAALGESYLIEVGGFDNLSGPGLLTIICEGAEPGEFDLGDAPDSSNNHGKRMSAYPDDGQGTIQGNFPSVFDGAAGGPRGPLHLAPLAVAHLGPGVTLEIEADKGADEDQANNLKPAQDEADKDGADDGVVLPLTLPHGEHAGFEYIVSVIQPDMDLWVNVWFDWNRDGDWDDDISDPGMVADGLKVSEWAVQNQLLYNLPIGTHHLMTPGFVAWHPAKGPEQVWMRITLSEQPWKGGATPGKLGNGGSGPAEGYAIGETEDYLLTPEGVCSLCQDRNEDGQINFDDLIALMEEWLACCSN